MSDFKVLSARDHTRMRPAMYIGAVTPTDVSGIIGFKYQTKTVVPGLLKIINEIIDNSTDEFIRTNGKHANQISVDIKNVGLAGWTVTVADNGRGIPVVQHDGRYQAELAWCEARAGSNFTDDGRTTIGMNGIGSFATNCFSTTFEGISCDGKQSVTVRCDDGCNTIKTTVGKSTKQGTSVTFVPDLSMFGIIDISQDHLDIIEDRLTNLAICYSGINFKFNGKTVSVKSSSQLAKSFHENAIAVEHDKSLFIIAPSGASEEFRQLSYINGLDMKNGGTHVDYIVNAIVLELIPAIKKKWKIEILPNQIKQHIIVACWIHGFENPRFDSQSKERLTNTPGEVKLYIQFDAAKLAKKILATEDIINPIVETALHKKELADRRAIEASLKNVSTVNFLKRIEKFDDATGTDRSKCSIFFTEGDSAAKPMVSSRTSSKHGVFPLKGKLLNVRDVEVKKLAANKEFQNIMSILGLKIGQKVASAADIRFGKVVVASDADGDGDHIFGLFLNMIHQFWPELFTLGVLYRLRTPLIIAELKGKRFEFFDLVSYNAWAATVGNHKHKFYKGLGSHSTKDFTRFLEDEDQYLLKISVEDQDDIDALNIAFDKSKADARKLWLLEK